MDRPWLAVDCVVFDGDCLLLIRRNAPPFEGCWALPGGFVEIGETTEAAAIRELKEETGIDAVLLGLVGVYSRPDRDPRHHVVSAAYSLRAVTSSPKGADDASDAEFRADWRDLELAFDHAEIIADAFKGA
jgi:8-oxo-dGTP diphosphatase